MAVESFSTERGQIFSELISYPNRSGRRITAYLDSATRELAGVPFVLMAPKYGETKKNNLQLAYTLVANGFAVLRFDFSNHVGESEGEMADFTMPGAVDDLVAGLDFLERRFAADSVVVVASSLSGRCALRAAAVDARIERLVCLVGVVNLQRTIHEMYQEDVFGRHLAGQVYGPTSFLGFVTNGATFLGSAVEANLHDLEGTMRDVEGIEISVTYFYAERDLWVDRDEVQRAFGTRSNFHLVPIEGAMHELRENVRAAETAYRATVRACLGRLGETPEVPVQVPDKRVVLAQNKRERDRLRQVLPEDGLESAFWTRYLSRYAALERAGAYRDYLHTVGTLLGEFGPGCRVLDAGCGNGHFGIWLWLRTLREERPMAAPPEVYVGIDLTAGGLGDSLRRHSALMLERAAPEAVTPPDRAMQYSYLQFDFDRIGSDDGDTALPFAEATFDKICCSLVISYLKAPERLLAELHRVLRPGGVLVLSSMKPFCDLSSLYRDYVVHEAGVNDLVWARGMLHAAGQLKLKEEKGTYTFFLAQELEELAGRVGFHSATSYSAFGNQSNVVRVLK